MSILLIILSPAPRCHKLRMSCPYTSPQNGKAERMIRTTNDVMRTLLIQASLPPRFWAESLHTATYWLNRLPSTASPSPTPHHALFGTPPRFLNFFPMFSDLRHTRFNKYDRAKLRIRRAIVRAGNSMKHRKRGRKCSWQILRHKATPNMVEYTSSSRNHLSCISLRP